MRFAPAPEYHVFPTQERPLKPYEAVRRATGVTRELVVAERPDVVVSDILTLAPALAAELEGVPWATLIPHVDPRGAPGFPPYSVGARLPRTALGRRAWSAFDPLIARGLELGRSELNETRSRLGLGPLAHVHGGISRQLAMVATFPQLEYPRPEPEPATHVVGPLQWEPPFGDVALPPGDAPLVLVAPSTAQDREGRMLAAALEAMADLPVRVLASTNKRGDVSGHTVPANARLVDWVSYSRTMPLCDLVVCHVGHGTLMRALSAGVPVVACPAAGDMNENAARAAWAGVGVRLPRRLVTARGLRLAVQRALADGSLRRRARELATWSGQHDPVDRAATLVEELAAGGLVRDTN
ncbi:4'-demethylrebeccamycin synthase [Baekduia alba]|uniref:glycosyltransferase n=1 Tax=Baekduia alba TaxID=2997333 RepID=UPI002340AB2B|nr:nucleotide disphospho-sugar-binding domain-containing protein [Baekduia alba]WCB94329.1 4'-demethylrebeccamycin synthase [Baekduia alba]